MNISSTPPNEGPIDERIAGRVEQLVTDLGDLRERRLSRIDEHRPPKRRRKELPELTQMADDYCATRRLVITVRGHRIQRLLQDALAVYAAEGGEDATGALSLLLLESSAARDQIEVRRAFLKVHGLTEDRWKSYWKSLRQEFAQFLVAFVAHVPSNTTESPAIIDSQPRRDFAAMLRHARALAGNPSYEDMSERTAIGDHVIPPSAFEMIERGDYVPPPYLVYAYADAIGLDPQLFEAQLRALPKTAREFFDDTFWPGRVRRRDLRKLP